MDWLELFGPAGIETGAALPSGTAAAARLIELFCAQGCVREKQAFSAQFLGCRHAPGIAVGQGIAIPHACGEFVAKAGLCALTLPQPVPYGADNEPCRLFLGIAAPAGGGVHMVLLSRLMMTLCTPGLPERLIAAPTPAVFRALLAEHAV